MSKLINALCAVCLVVLGALSIAEARADGLVLVHESANLGRIRVFTAEPCTGPSVGMVAQLGADAADYHKAVVTYEGKAYEACAAVLVQLGGVCVVVNDLGHVDVPISMFKKDEGV